MAGARVAQMWPVAAEEFRQALSLHAGGVAVVTGPGPIGLTVTSFSSASLDPPLVSLYVARSSSTWPGLRHAAAFAVNVLADDQAGLAIRFADQDVDRFAGPTRWRLGPLGVPLLDGAVAWLVCGRHQILAVGDHWLLVGLVIGTELGGATAPLLYHSRRFGGFRLTCHEQDALT